MKTKVLSIVVVIMMFASCSGLKHVSSYDDNDTYISAKEEKQKQEKLIAEKKRLQAEHDKFTQDSTAKEQEKIANNPYYKDPNYSKDDYYDYGYASKIKRFYNPVNGLGYYDNWYTNPAFYGSPYYGNGYGSSIYMGTGVGYGYNPYSMGYGYGMGYGMGGYGSPYYGMGGYGNPYYGGYGSPYYSPWGSPYYGYGMGYGMGGYYGNPYYGYGMGYGGYPYYGGYYNSSDVNSMSYGPRGSHEGFNSRQTANNINDGNSFVKYNNSAISIENHLPKFDEMAKPKMVTNFNPTHVNAMNNTYINHIAPINAPTVYPKDNSSGNNVVNYNPFYSNGNHGRGGNNVGNGGNNNPKPVPVEVSPKNNNNSFQNNSMQRGWNSGGSGFGGGGGGFGGGGGGSSPRVGGRPR